MAVIRREKLSRDGLVGGSPLMVCRVPARLKREVQEYAAGLGIGWTQLVRQMIEDFMERRKVLSPERPDGFEAEIELWR